MGIGLDAAQLVQLDALGADGVHDAVVQAALFDGAAAVLHQHLGGACGLELTADGQLGIAAEDGARGGAEREILHVDGSSRFLPIK